MSDIVMDHPLTLAQALVKAHIDARKAKDSVMATAIGVVLAEAKQLATRKENRDPTDEEVISVIKKILEGIAESIKYETDDIRKATLIEERQGLQKFMPTQLSEVEISVIIENAALDNLGKIMQVFKLHYPGKYDGKVVSRIASEYLKKV